MGSGVLVTGAAGFIGFHLARRLLSDGVGVIGVDNINDYYDTGLKEDRLALLASQPGFAFYRTDLMDGEALAGIFAAHRPDRVVNLAAQAGVRYSIDAPRDFLDSNVIGFLNVLEACRAYPVSHLLYASSSSVYGGNTEAPFSTRHNVDRPVSMYAATKKTNELMAHTYSHLFRIPSTGLRFFTVYGPWGRPDMAYCSFAKNIFEGKPVTLFNNGDMQRDFTYVDDVVEAIVRLLDRPPRPAEDPAELAGDPSISTAPYKIYNIGNRTATPLADFIDALEAALGKKAVRQFAGMQPGDVAYTCADTSDLERDIGFQPCTSIREGLACFADWYRRYYGQKE